LPRLAIVSSHPIQYNAPVFRALAAYDDLTVHVFFGWRGTENQVDVEFGRRIAWDIPLTDGYEYTLVENVASNPGTHHFMGLRNPEMCEAIADFQPDALLVYGWSSWTHLEVLRRFHNRIPVLFRGDSTLLSSDKWWKAALRKQGLTWVYRHIDRALYVGRRNREYFGTFGVPPSKLTWAPHSIDFDRFSGGDNLPLHAEAEAARASLGISPKSITYLFAGKLVPRKEPEALIASFLGLLRSRSAPKPHLLVVGTGPLEAELRASVAGIGNVHFLGFRNQSEMPMAYRMGDVFVLPSSRETWGLAVNEAMACGRVVIVSDRVGCAPDLACDPRFSSIFSSSDPKGLTSAMASWARPRSEVLAAGQLARAFISSWSTEAAASAIHKAILMELRRGRA
jgi:glycosyltransferase involved in cell wall biosynthesis